MSHNFYSSFRTPQTNKKQQGTKNYNGNGFNTLSAVGRKKNFGGVGPTNAYNLGNSSLGGANNIESRLGNGYSTLPSRFHRKEPIHDPLNNVNRFKKQIESTETESPNQFNFYGSQQVFSQEVPDSTVSTLSRRFNPKPKLVAPEQPSRVFRIPEPKNKPSILLSAEENRSIFEILGPETQTLVTTVGRLLIPTPDQRKWVIKGTGAVCLIRDTIKQSYFIQIVSLGTRKISFRQEIYNHFVYRVPQATFMTFEGDSSMVAILFADPTEACNFCDALDDIL